MKAEILEKCQLKDGYYYFLTIIDHHTGFTHVEPLKDKSEAPQVLIEYLNHLRNCFNRGPKHLRIDRAREFDTNELRILLKSLGTKFQPTNGYSSKQNPKVERKYRTLLDAAGAMLFELRLPKNLWPLAVKHACYVQNQFPYYKTEISPSRAFLGQSEDFDLRIFGDKFSLIFQNQNKMENFSLMHQLVYMSALVKLIRKIFLFMQITESLKLRVTLSLKLSHKLMMVQTLQTSMSMNKMIILRHEMMIMNQKLVVIVTTLFLILKLTKEST